MTTDDYMIIRVCYINIKARKLCNEFVNINIKGTSIACQRTLAYGLCCSTKEGNGETGKRFDRKQDAAKDFEDEVTADGARSHKLAPLHNSHTRGTQPRACSCDTSIRSSPFLKLSSPMYNTADTIGWPAALSELFKVLEQIGILPRRSDLASSIANANAMMNNA